VGTEKISTNWNYRVFITLCGIKFLCGDVEVFDSGVPNISSGIVTETFKNIVKQRTTLYRLLERQSLLKALLILSDPQKWFH
jgi:hypothetical protein